jgi:hypothetical protein
MAPLDILTKFKKGTLSNTPSVMARGKFTIGGGLGGVAPLRGISAPVTRYFGTGGNIVIISTAPLPISCG